jgi:hypothetical protein
MSRTYSIRLLDLLTKFDLQKKSNQSANGVDAILRYLTKTSR